MPHVGCIAANGRWRAHALCNHLNVSRHRSEPGAPLAANYARRSGAGEALAVACLLGVAEFRGVLSKKFTTHDSAAGLALTTTRSCMGLSRRLLSVARRQTRRARWVGLKAIERRGDGQ
jgi:hypothetical protein